MVPENIKQILDEERLSLTDPNSSAQCEYARVHETCLLHLRRNSKFAKNKRATSPTPITKLETFLIFKF